MASGQSSVGLEFRPETFVGSGEFAKVNCGQSDTESRTVRNIVLSLSRDVGSYGRSAGLSCRQSTAT